jgi:hypothetical protein
MRQTFTTVTLPLAAVVVATVAAGEAALRGAPAKPASTLEEAVASITPALIRSHVEFLSHDLLEGRDTGHRGFEIAREYVASQFRRIGLEARNRGSYLQPFDVLAAGADTGSELRVSGETITAADASFAPDWNGRRSEVRAPGAFAGQGLVTTGRDDYAGLDVRGKIVFLLPGVPTEWAEHPERSLLGRTKIDAALKRGAMAVAMLSLDGPAPQGRAMALADGTASAPRASVTVGAAASKRLLAAWGSTPKAIGDVVLSVKRERTPLQSWNVVGVLPGKDPALRDESIVFTAHLDHVGIGEPDEAGDRIFNGTHDNALGIGKLLASAEAMARLEPKRTIVFAAVGAEERGMLGSYYYIGHPVAPNPVAAINHDGGLEGPATDDVFAFGGEYSSLGAALDVAAKRIGMRVATEYPTPFSPSQALLFRSDHYPFLRAGVPGIYLMDGFTIGGDPERGRTQWARYLANVNHKQRDNFDPAWTFESPVRMAALSVGLAWDLANAPARPAMKTNTMFPSPKATPSTQGR